jgi:hypothetical protein
MSRVSLRRRRPRLERRVVAAHRDDLDVINRLCWRGFPLLPNLAVLARSTADRDNVVVLTLVPPFPQPALPALES